MGNQSSLVILVALGGAWSYGLYQLLQQRVPTDSTSKQRGIIVPSNPATWIPTSYPTPWDPYGFPLEPYTEGPSTTQGPIGPITPLGQGGDPSIPASQGWWPTEPILVPQRPPEPPDTPFDWFNIESRGRYNPVQPLDLGPLYKEGWKY